MIAESLFEGVGSEPNIYHGRTIFRRDGGFVHYVLRKAYPIKRASVFHISGTIAKSLVDILFWIQDFFVMGADNARDIVRTRIAEFNGISVEDFVKH